MTDSISIEELQQLPWDQREPAIRKEMAARLADVGELARMRADALDEGFAKLGSNAAVGRKLGLSRQVVGKARSDGAAARQQGVSRSRVTRERDEAAALRRQMEAGPEERPAH